MNIKLHTPKSLKMGSGMASAKQFLLSLLATSVSIALTFGTAAIIDYNAKQKSKREIVMMVMYDMHNSLKSIEEADSKIRLSMDVQRQIAEDTTQFDKLRFQMARLIPRAVYTETTERIFSSSIETINTVGNVLFTENVAEFYQNRQLYKTTICDSIANEVTRQAPISIKGTLDFDFMSYAILSCYFLKDLRHLYHQCKQMMDVTDEEIEAYRKEKEQMEKSISEEQGNNSDQNEVIQLQEKINAAKEKIN